MDESESGNNADIGRLRQIMRQLRSPDTGCPWDLEQTFSSIAPYTIEEAYEVADAIERGDMEDLVDELGDLLLQVVFHTQIAEEAGQFGFSDVVDAISAKMIRRHPHVFGSAKARDAGAVKGMWEQIKRQEAAQKQAMKGGEPSRGRLLDDVPIALPALSRAVKLQKKAAQVDFDWPTIAPVFDKIREELEELEVAIAEADRGRATHAMKEETGDLLFAIANLARHLGFEPEAALQGANAKFIRRFGYIEDGLAANNRSLEEASLDDMEELWNSAKALEKQVD